MIKIGLIGTGFMGGMHALCYEALTGRENFKVTAVADNDSEKAKKIAQKFDAQVFSSGEELIDNADVNTIDICLPTYLHAVHAVKAMEKGCNVFIEKPVCLTEQEATQLLEVKKKTGVKVMVGHCIRFWNEYVYLKNLIDSKTYGNVVSAVFKRISPRPGWAWDGWLLDRERSGQAALDLHIHDVDFVRYILGNPLTLKSEVANSGEHIFTTYRYKDAVVSIEGGWDFPASFPFKMEYRVIFEKAVVIFNSGKMPSLIVYENDGNLLYPEMEENNNARSGGLDGNISSLGGYYNEIKYFLEKLNKGESIDVAPLEEGIRSFMLTIKEIEAGR